MEVTELFQSKETLGTKMGFESRTFGGTRCCGSKKLKWRNKLTNWLHRDRLQGQPNFLDFDMLDAMIASALKKLINTHSTFRKRASVEEQRAQNSDRFFFRGRQIACMIYEYFRATGAYETVHGLGEFVSMTCVE